MHIIYVLNQVKQKETFSEWIVSLFEHTILFSYIRLRSSRGSSASIVSGYSLDDRAIEVRSPAKEKGFFL
jgi:hypothetical protein